MTYPNVTPPTTVVVDTGNAIHRAAHSLAFTGIDYLPLIVAGVLSLLAGLAIWAWSRWEVSRDS